MNFTGLPLTSTFIHLPGISLRRERELWNKGILDWHQFQEAVSVGKLSQQAYRNAVTVVRASLRAVEQRDSASFTSVFRPGTFFTCWALARTICNGPSKIAYAGFQYTPVLSIATWVQPCASNHSRRPSSSRVVVPKVRICFSTLPQAFIRATMLS